ncbi:MAG: B12-binding domain-containing radical SAM protein [Candidatus Woesearchaeota archaeon]
MKALLIYPSCPETFWSFKHVLKFVSRKAAFPPLGILTVASMMPDEWDKRLVDLNVRDLKDEDIIWADYCFISAMMIQKESALSVISRCKVLGKKVVVGGPCFNETRQFPLVDHFVLNEAEVTLPLFLRGLSEGNLDRVYSSMERPDITKTPAPMWSLINFRDYSTMAVQFSRGCPFDCEFCDIVVMNGRIPRTKTPEQFISEIDDLHNAGWRGTLFIVDDNFLGNKKKVKEMLAVIVDWQKEHKYPFRLFTEASINLADDDDLLNLMRDANFCKVFLGLETPHADSLHECGKLQNINRDLAADIKVIQQHGMQVMGGFIVGFDNDTEKIFDTQINFIQKVGVVTAMVGLLNVLPQTRLWHRLRDENRLMDDCSGANTDGSINFVPKMDRAKLIDGYKRIIGTIYSPKEYYKRINTFVKNYRPSARGRITLPEWNAFMRSMWMIGIVSRARHLYWKLLVKTWFTNIKAFPVAVELAIIGLHFQKVSARVAA